LPHDGDAHRPGVDAQWCRFAVVAKFVALVEVGAQCSTVQEHPGSPGWSFEIR
jgi:hypothetical protein